MTDQVKCLTDRFTTMTKGKIYPILSIDGDRFKTVRDDGKEVFRFLGAYSDFERVELEEKIMTPCEERGWKEGDLFEMTVSDGFGKGDVVRLFCDDSSDIPLFVLEVRKSDVDYDDNEPNYVSLDNLKKIEEEPSYQNPPDIYQHNLQISDPDDSAPENPPAQIQPQQSAPQKSGVLYNGILYETSDPDEMIEIANAIHTLNEWSQSTI